MSDGIELQESEAAEFDDELSDEALDRQDAAALTVHSSCFTAGH